MKLSSKTAGFGLMAVAGLLLCSAAIADTMGPDRGPGMMGPGHMALPSVAAMDANKDGKLSKDEVTGYRRAAAAAVDANGDGKLSVDELTAMRLKAMTDAARTMAQKMVDRIDTDADGMLSVAELIAPPVPLNMFDRLDANKDGFLDQAELDVAQQAMMQNGPGRDGGRGGRHGDHMMPGAPDDGKPDQTGNGGN